MKSGEQQFVPAVQQSQKLLGPRPHRRSKTAGGILKLIAAGAVIAIAGSGFVSGAPADAVANGVQGTVWQDFNADGFREDGSGSRAAEPGIPDVQLRLVGADGQLLGTTTTDASGKYNFGSLTTGEKYRVELEKPAAPWEHGFQGPDSKGNVRFVSEGDENVDFSLQIPAEYYGSENPLVWLPVMNTGPWNGANANRSAGGLQPFQATGNYYEAPPKVWNVTHAQVGSTYGSAWKRPTSQGETGTQFLSSYLRLGTDFGPGGLGAIYAVSAENMTSPQASASVFIDLATKFNLGTVTRPTTLQGFWYESGTLHYPSGSSTPTYVVGDTAQRNKVGRTGLGGMAISADEETLYVVNLFRRTVIAVPIENPNGATEHAIPGLPSYAQPFGITVDKKTGDVLVSASDTHTSDPYTYVFRVNKGNFSNVQTVLQQKLSAMQLQNTVDSYGSRINQFMPWTEYDKTGKNVPGTNDAYSTHTAMMAVEVEVFGDDLILGFRNRAKDWEIELVWPINAGAFTAGGFATVATTTNGGNSYSVTQTNIRVQVLGSASAPGHGFTNFGPMLYNPAFTDYVLHAGSRTGGSGGYPLGAGRLDPGLFGGSYPSNMNPNTGALIGGTGNLETHSGNSFGEAQLRKSNGLGDLTLLMDPAPIQIGDRVWLDGFDGENNGTQDATELALSGVTVRLLTSDGNSVLATTTTDADGLYKFDSRDTPLDYTSEYIVEFDYSTMPEATLQAIADKLGIPRSAFIPEKLEWTLRTTSDAAAHESTNVDSNPDRANGRTPVSTEGPGKNDPTIDAGIIYPRELIVYEKASDPEPGTLVSPGDEITYTVTVSNLDTRANTSESVTDDLANVLDKAEMKTDAAPALRCETANGDPAPTANCGILTYDETAEKIQWKSTVATPIDGQTVAKIEYTVVINDDATGTVGNVLVGKEIQTEHPVLLSGKLSDPASGSQVLPGDEVTYTIWFENSGEVDATSMIAADGTTVPLAFVDDLSAVVDKATLLPDATNPLITLKSTGAGETCDTATGGAIGQAQWNPNLATINWTGEALPKDTRVCVSYSVEVDQDAVGTLKNVFLDHSTEHLVPANLSWKKVDANGVTLIGSEWKLTPILTDENGVPVVDADGNSVVDPDRETLSPIDDCHSDNTECSGVDSDPAGGSFLVEGVSPGLYELEETKAPAGFQKLSAPIKIIVVDDQKLTVHGDVVNLQQGVPMLPLTGGIGSDHFLIGGALAALLMMVVIAANELKRRRKSLEVS